MKIYVIGDSISIQYGPYLKTYLTGFMEYSRKEGEDEALLDLDKPQGANGGDSSMVLSFLEARARAGGIDADLLLLNCGLHDIKTNPVTGEKQIPLESYRVNLKSIVSTVAALRRPRMVWIRTTPCDEVVHNTREKTFHRFAADARRYNEVADAIMTAAGIPMIDLFTFTCNLGADLYCDHVHFQLPVREKQAAFIAGWLQSYTREQRSC